MHRQVLIKAELYLVSLWILFACIFFLSYRVDGANYCSALTIYFAGHGLCWGGIVSVASLCLAIAGLLFFWRFVVRIKGAGGVTLVLKSVEDLGQEQISFLATYVIPFTSFEIASVRKTVLLAALLVITGAMYISMDKYYANPTLTLMGFKVYKAVYLVGSGEEKEAVLVSRQKLQKGNRVRMLAFAEGACFARLAGTT